MARSRINGDAVWFVFFLVQFLVIVAAYAAVLAEQLSTPALKTPYRDAIYSCLERSGMPVYAVGKDGPPMPGQALTAEMITIICVEEK